MVKLRPKYHNWCEQYFLCICSISITMVYYMDYVRSGAALNGFSLRYELNSFNRIYGIGPHLIKLALHVNGA